MYTIATYVESRGADTSKMVFASSIPEALTVLAGRLIEELRHGAVVWKITDPDGGEHRGRDDLRGCLDEAGQAVYELVQDLYAQLHRAADGWGRPAMVGPLTPVGRTRLRPSGSAWN